MSNTNPQRKMSRLQLKKLKAAAEDNDKIRVDYKRATTTITKIERELKDARERNEVQNKYWHNIGVERNTLKERVEELETELYFCNRNNKIEEIIDKSISRIWTYISDKINSLSNDRYWIYGSDI